MSTPAPMPTPTPQAADTGAAQGAGITAVGGMVSVCKEDANRYCEILTLLGMEEEGDPVAEVQRLQDRAAHAIWSIWEALPGYLIDNCEGTPVSEEMLQHALSKMLADPQYKAPDWAAAPQPAPPADSVLKDHQIAALVKELRDIAIEFHGAQQLRERIAQVVVPALKAKSAYSVPEDAARWKFVEANLTYAEFRDGSYFNTYQWPKYESQQAARAAIDAAISAQQGDSHE